MKDCTAKTGLAEDMLESFPEGNHIDLAELLPSLAAPPPPPNDEREQERGDDGAQNSMQSVSLADGLMNYGKRAWQERGGMFRPSAIPWAVQRGGGAKVFGIGFVPTAKRF